MGASVDLGVAAAQGPHGRFSTQGLEVCPAVTDSPLGNVVFERNRERRVPGVGVDVQDVTAGGGVGEGKPELSIEAAGTTEGGVTAKGGREGGREGGRGMRAGFQVWMWMSWMVRGRRAPGRVRPRAEG